MHERMFMKQLMLMRHAKSSWDDPQVDDYDRDLNERGKKACKRMGDWFVEHDLIPDLILSSTAIRAKETTERLIERWKDPVDVLWMKELYLAPPQTLMEAITSIDDRINRVLVVAHNPGMEQLVNALRQTYTAFPTAALACMESPIDHWQKADQSPWTCLHFVCPKEM